MIRYVVVVLTFLSLSSCLRPLEMIKIDFGAEDNCIEQRINLTFKNSYPFCIRLSRSMWPTEKGILDGKPWTVYLLIEEEKFYLRTMNLDDCAGECPGRKVQPGETITGFFLYRDFGIPAHLFDKEKELVFTPVGYKCK